MLDDCTSILYFVGYVPIDYILLSEESKPDVKIEQPKVVQAQAKPSRKDKKNSLIGAIKKKQLQHCSK